jgi:VIT1/CCC1 family predicted Fe2+/Mn2+ transporter
LGGIFTIAIADAVSDALGIHISEESQKKHSLKSVWESTGAALVSKFVFAAIFIAPVLLLDLKTAVMASIGIGAIVLGTLSYYIAKIRKIEPWRAILEHLFIAAIVVVLTHYAGTWISMTFG